MTKRNEISYIVVYNSKEDIRKSIIEKNRSHYLVNFLFNYIYNNTYHSISVGTVHALDQRNLRNLYRKFS